MNPQAGITVFQWINFASNCAAIIIGITVIRRFSRLEFQVETLWSMFIDKQGHVYSRKLDEVD